MKRLLKEGKIKIILFLFLCLVNPRAVSKELFSNNSLDTCYVLAIANVDLTTDLQKNMKGGTLQRLRLSDTALVMMR